MLHRRTGSLDTSNLLGEQLGRSHVKTTLANESDSATRLMLEQQKHSPSYSTLSAVQAAAVEELLGAADLGADAKLELATLLVGVPWACDQHAQRAMGPLSSAEASGPPAGKRRRGQQDYKRFARYFTSPTWSSLTDPSLSPDAKLSVVLQHLLRLGLRLPTEHSLKLVASFWMVVSSRSLDTIDAVSKSMNMKHVKASFDALRFKCQDPVSWVTKLPEKPVELLRDFSALYTSVFTGPESPAAPGINLDVLHAFDLSYTCRGGLKNMVQFGSGTSSAVAVPIARGLGPVGVPCMQEPPQWMAAFMPFLQNMMSTQQRVVELMTKPETSGGHVRSLAALEDRSARHAPLQRTNALALGAGPLVEELVDSPPPKQEQQALASASSAVSLSASSVGGGDASPSGVSTPLALVEARPAPVGTSPSAAQDISAMMSMLAERKAATALASKAAQAKTKSVVPKSKGKAAAKVAAAVDPPSAHLAVPQGKATTAKPSATAKVAAAKHAVAAAAKAKVAATATAAKAKAAAKATASSNAGGRGDSHECKRCWEGKGGAGCLVRLLEVQVGQKGLWTVQAA